MLIAETVNALFSFNSFCAITGKSGAHSEKYSTLRYKSVHQMPV